MFARNLLAEIDRALEEEVAELEQEIHRSADFDELLRQLDRNFANHPIYELQIARPDGEIVFATPAARRSPTRCGSSS